MAAAVDNRVVSMEFNNAQFEKNVATSMQTLKKLDDSMQFKNAEKSFDDLEKAAQNVKLSSISDALDKLNSHFSVWGIASRKIIEDIVGMAERAAAKMYNATIGQVMSGGWTRASNIEQAKFQLEGLNIAWRDVSESIDYAVSGTAYGLDSAAKAASQLAASGVNLGQDMSDALRGISGVAAMTNSSYDEIANIFATVAGNGRLMTMQLNQIGARGINAAAELAKAMGITEKELRELVTKGQIDFNTFAKAMDSAFGEHAKDANKTFTGVMSNIRAALSRIGAEFATPILTDMVAPLNQLKDMIVAVKTAMQPIFDIWQNFASGLGIFLDLMGQGINDSKIIPNIVDTITNLFAALLNILITVGEGFHNAFPEVTIQTIEEFTGKLKSFAEGLILSEENEENLRKTSEGLFSILKFIGDIIGNIIYVLSPLTKLIEPIGTAILKITGTLGDWISKITEYITQSEFFQAAVQYAYDAVDFFATNLPGMLETAFGVIKPIIDGVIDVFKKLAEALGVDLSQITVDFENFKIEDLIDSTFNVIRQLITNFLTFLGVSKEDIDNFFNNFKFPTFEESIQFIKDLFTNLTNAISGNTDEMGESEGKIGNIFDFIGQHLQTGKDHIGKFISFITEHVDIKQVAAIGMVAFLALFAKKIFDFIGSIKKAATDILSPGLDLKKNLESILGGISDVISTSKDVMKAEILMKIAESIAILVGSLFLLSTIPIDQLVFATGALGLVGYGLKQFIDSLVEITKDVDSKKLVAAASELIAIGAAILLISVAVSVLGNMGLPQLAEGVGGLAVVLLELYLFLDEMQKVTPVAAGNILVLAIALDALIPVIALFAALPLPNLIIAEAALGALLAILSEFAGRLDAPKLAATAAGMLVLALAIDALVPALLVFALLPLPNLIQGVAAVGAMLAIFSEFAGKINGPQLIATAAGLVVLAAAIDLSTIAIIAFSSIPLSQLVKGILAFGAALLVMGGASALLGIFSPLVMAGAVAIGILGAAVLAAGVGVLAFSAGLTALIGVFSLLGTTVNLVGPQFQKNITDMIVGVAQGIANAAKDTATAFLNMVMSWLDVIQQHAQEIVGKVIDVVIAIGTAIGENAPKILAAIGQAIVDAVKYIIEHKEDILEAAKKMFQGFIDGIKAMVEFVINAIKDVLNNINEAIFGFVDKIKDAAKNLIGGFIEGITGKKDDASTSGEEVAQGLIDGMDAKADEVKDKGEEIGQASIDGVYEGAGTHSRSWKSFISGEEVDDGQIDGMESKIDEVKKMGGQVGQAGIDGIQDVIDKIGPDLGKDIDLNVIGGIGANLDGVTVSGEGLGFSALTGVTNVTNSGSFEKAGSDGAKEVVEGVTESLPEVEDAGEGIGITAYEALTGWIGDHDISGLGRQQGEGFGDGLDSASSGIDATAQSLAIKLPNWGYLHVKDAAAAGAAQAQAFNKSLKAASAVGLLKNKTAFFNESQMLKKAAKPIDVAQKEAAAVDKYTKKNRVLNAINKYKAQQKALEDAKDDLDDTIDSPPGGSGGGGSGGGGGGSGTSKATEEVKELFDVMTDAKDVVEDFQKRFIDLDETLEENAETTELTTDGYEVSKEAVTAFARAVYESTDDYDEAMKSMDKNSAEYLEAMKKSWDSYKDNLEKAITGSIDAFAEFSTATHVSAEDMLDNINSEIVGLKMFEETIAGLSESNINPDILRELVDGGISNMDKLMGLLYATDEQRESINKAYETLDNISGNTTNKIMASLALSYGRTDETLKEALEGSEIFQNSLEKLESATGVTASQITVMFNETQQGIKQVIKSGLDVFSEYTKAEKVSKKELQKNLDDNKKAWQDWGDAVNELIAKGLDQAIVQNLIDKGLEGMGEMQGFLDMTEEEINKYNEGWAESMLIPDKVSAEIAANYTAVALDLAKAFGDGLEATDAEKAAEDMADASVKALENALGDKGSVQGSALAKSFDDGFKDNARYVYDTVKEFGENIIDGLELDEEDVSDIGLNIMKGLAAGIKDNSYLVVDAIEEVMEDVNDKAEEVPKIGSPSKVFMQIGKFIDEGLAIGISDNARGVVRSVEDMGETSLDAMQGVIAHILDVLEGNVDMDPTIRPVLDLSDIEDKAGDISSLLNNNTSLSMARGISLSQAPYGFGSSNTNNYSTPISINIYGGADDAETIAEAVQNKINHQVRRLGIA